MPHGSDGSITTFSAFNSLSQDRVGMKVPINVKSRVDVDGLDENNIYKAYVLKTITTIKHEADRHRENSNCYIKVELSDEDIILRKNMYNHYSRFGIPFTEPIPVTQAYIDPKEAIYTVMLGRIIRKFLMKYMPTTLMGNINQLYFDLTRSRLYESDIRSYHDDAWSLSMAQGELDQNEFYSRR
jgi:hypothetical protein